MKKNEKLPYPFCFIYEQLNTNHHVTTTDLDNHLQAMNILMRYAAYLNIIKYMSEPDYDPIINKKIEGLFSEHSLFQFVLVGKDIVSFLNEREQFLHFGFNQFYRDFLELPDKEELPLSEKESRDYDLANISKLCGIDIIANAEQIYQEEELRAKYCNAMKYFFKDTVLKYKCFHECKIVFRKDQKTDDFIIADEINQWNSVKVPCEIFIMINDHKYKAYPFFVFGTVKHQNMIKILYKMNRRGGDVSYIYFNKKNIVFDSESKDISFPWATVSIERVIKDKIIYHNEIHKIKLKLTNSSNKQVSFDYILEELPENLESFDKLSYVNIFVNLTIPPSQIRYVEYKVRGKFTGQRQYIKTQKICYKFGENQGFDYIEGDVQAIVKTLPKPRINIERKLFVGKKTFDCDTIKIDEELTVIYEIESMGARIDSIKFEDNIQGREIVDLKRVFYKGPLERCGLQHPFSREYKLHMNNIGKLLIKTTFDGMPQPQSNYLKDVKIEILDAEPPEITLEQTEIRTIESQDDLRGIHITFGLKNTGGTTAYNISLNYKVPENIKVQKRCNQIFKKIKQGDTQYCNFKIYFKEGERNSIFMEITYCDIKNKDYSNTENFPLTEIIEENLDNILVLGRENAKQNIRRYLKEGGEYFLNLLGERGVGKRFILINEISEFKKEVSEKKIVIHSVDCREVKTFNRAMANVVESIIFQKIQPVFANKIEKRDTIGRFFESINISENESQQIIEDINILLNREDTVPSSISDSIIVFLGNLILYKQFEILVLFFSNIDEINAGELILFDKLYKNFRNFPVRIITTSRSQISEVINVQHVEVRKLHEKECTEYINRVFIYPSFQEYALKAILDRSEKNPSNLKSLIEKIIKYKNKILDFSNPLGITFTNWDQFYALPISQLKLLTDEIKEYEDHKEVLICLGISLDPLTSEEILKIFEYINVGYGTESVKIFLDKMLENKWLIMREHKYYQIEGPVRREAIFKSFPKIVSQKVHQAFFEYYKSINRDLVSILDYLIESDIDYIKKNEELLFYNIRLCLNKGMFGMVKRCIERLQKYKSEISVALQIQFAIIKEEINRIEKGELDIDLLNKLDDDLEKIEDKKKRRLLEIQIFYLGSLYYKEIDNDIQRAIELAEEMYTFRWAFKFLKIDDNDLNFDYHLNLWELYYLNRDKYNIRKIEKEFIKLDNKIWKMLEIDKNKRHIAKFLTLFLKLHREYRSEADRKESFPSIDTQWEGETVLLRDNEIEKATRLEKIQDRFVSYLNNPETLKLSLNLQNELLFGRISFLAGLRKWETAIADNTENENHETLNQIYNDYLMPTETKFQRLGAQIDLLNGQYEILSAYYKLLESSFNKKNDSHNKELFNFIAKYVVQGNLIERLDNFHFIKQALKSAEIWANTAYWWAKSDPERLSTGTSALELVLEREQIQKDDLKHDNFTLKLAELYKKGAMNFEALKALLLVRKTTSEINVLSIYLKLENLMDVQNEIEKDEIEQYEKGLQHVHEFVKKQMDSKWLRFQVEGRGFYKVDRKQIDSDGFCTLKYMNTDIDVIDLQIRLTWKIIEYYYQEENGKKTLEHLRIMCKVINDNNQKKLVFIAQIPEIFTDSWIGEGSLGYEIISDFELYFIPLLEIIDEDILEKTIKKVHDWENEREGLEDTFSSVKMNIIMAEKYIEMKKFDKSRMIAQANLSDIPNQILRSYENTAKISAESLGILLVCQKYDESISDFSQSLKKTINVFTELEAFDSLLIMFVRLIKFLMNKYEVTKDESYYQHVIVLSKQMKTAQKSSKNLMPVIMDLVQIYLQIPGYIGEVIPLLEQQCQYFINNNELDMLPEYLTFLSDLSGSMESRINAANNFDIPLKKLKDNIYQLLNIGTNENDLIDFQNKKEPNVSVKESKDIIDGLLHSESDEDVLTDFEDKIDSSIKEVKTQDNQDIKNQEELKMIKEITIKLSADIIEKLDSMFIKTTLKENILYNTAKLLNTPEVMDINAAIYAKLFQDSVIFDPTIVWAFYNTWSSIDLSGSKLTNADKIALSALSLADTEDTAGKPIIRGIADIRNYLTGSDHRNFQLIYSTGNDKVNQLCGYYLEVQRIDFLITVISELRELLKKISDQQLTSIGFLNFLYEYITEGEELTLPELKKVQEIELSKPKQQTKKKETESRLHELSFELKILSEVELDKFIRKSIWKNREKGQIIMQNATQNIFEYSMSSILDEAILYLRKNERRTDFKDILPLLN